MSPLEVISRMCDVTNNLSEIVRKQQEIIEQMKVDNTDKEELCREIGIVEKELDIIECASRKYCDVDDIEKSYKDIYDVEITSKLMMEVEARSRLEAEEKAKCEYMDFTHIPPKTARAWKRGEKWIDG